MIGLNRRVAGGDGTALAVDLHVPAQQHWPVPAVVTRTAYSRTLHLAEGGAWQAAGVAFVAQDVRGRYDSDGTWVPYRGERSDGAALVDHLLEEPWCDGTIIAYGGSYSGYTAWAMAVERPAAVRGVISLGASLGLHRTKFTEGGILRLSEHVGWWLERADGRTSRPGLREAVLTREPDLLRHLPVVDIGARSGVDLPHLDDALIEFEEFGRDGTPPEGLTGDELRGLDCSTFHAGGWYDLLAPEVLGLWETVGAAVHPRPARRLVMGPWGHDLGMAGSSRTGVLEHGPGSRRDWGREFLQWVADVRRGSAPTSAEAFRTGASRWVSGPTWPPAGIVRRFFPGPEGTLTDRPTAGSVSFVHDPLDPYPSFLPGTDRSGTWERTDVARFATAPLTHALVLDGSAVLRLVTGTGDGADADWIARLLEQRPDGLLVELAVATATGAHPERAVFGPTCAELPTGSRLVLEVTGSDFPYLARNLGSGQDRFRGTRTAQLRQHVWCGPGGTALDLPLGVAA